VRRPTGRSDREVLCRPRGDPAPQSRPCPGWCSVPGGALSRVVLGPETRPCPRSVPATCDHVPFPIGSKGGLVARGLERAAAPQPLPWEPCRVLLPLRGQRGQRVPWVKGAIHSAGRFCFLEVSSHTPRASFPPSPRRPTGDNRRTSTAHVSRASQQRSGLRV
jgi:hypothetical protein